MPSSGYAAITFVANEQPTTAKWNLIGSNDASFNTGAGFNDAIIINRHIAAGSIFPNQLQNDTNASATSWSTQEYGSTSTISGFTGTMIEKTIRYFQLGKVMYIWFTIGGTSNATAFTFTVPIAAKAIPSNGSSANNYSLDVPSGLVISGGAVQAAPARIYIDPTVNLSLVNIVPAAGTGAFATTGTKDCRGFFFYEVA